MHLHACRANINTLTQAFGQARADAREHPSRFSLSRAAKRVCDVTGRKSHRLSFKDVKPRLDSTQRPAIYSDKDDAAEYQRELPRTEKYCEKGSTRFDGIEKGQERH